MILTGNEIRKRMGEDIVIKPYDDSKINPNSYNLRLYKKLLVYEEDVLDMRKPNKVKEIEIPKDGLLLQPNKLYLGRTLEYTSTKNLVPMLEGRSSIGRLGLFIHVTAGFGDDGFSGYWTLEILCTEPIIIYPEVDICQIFYHTTIGDRKSYDGGKYQNNDGIQASMLWKDFK
ncbi:MAG: dCTP deaminase [Lachnospirales bacterium]